MIVLQDGVALGVSGSPSGTAGGVLSGSYPNPAHISGNLPAAGAIALQPGNATQMTAFASGCVSIGNTTDLGDPGCLMFPVFSGQVGPFGLFSADGGGTGLIEWTSGNLFVGSPEGVLTLRSGSYIQFNQTFGVGGAPAASAAVDVQSTTQGVLLPRMTTTQKNAISSPAEGLVVYDLTLHALCVFNGTAWKTVTAT